jgi:hypothetical protein
MKTFTNRGGFEMTNTAMIDEPETKQSARHALPEPWVPISVLSMLGAGSAASLEDKAEKIAMRLEDSPAGACVETRHLKALLPPELVKLARAYQPTWGPILRPDHEALGFEAKADVRDVLALLERRGVMVKDDQADRTAMNRLAQLLERERRFPVNDTDLVMCETVWGKLAEMMHTNVQWEAPPTPPPPPRVRRPWDDPLREDTRKDMHRQRYDPDEEPANRCQCMGIRAGDHPNQAFGRGRKYANKFDLYRRLDLVFDRPADLTYRVKEYREMMTMAYNDVFASTNDHANV